MPEFGQVFYGRSRDGYGILGASPSGRPFGGFVAALCRAVGSPDRPGDIQPFLISKREGSSVIMIRACRGDADPTGRSTLFFHALVAPVEVLSSANLDAFALAEKGVFLSTLSKSVEDIEVSASTGQSDSAPSDELRFPAFVSSDRPLDAEVRRVLGRETLTRNWATYSYRPLDGFDLCVHSSYASSPTSGNRYTLENGRFVTVDSPRAVSPSPQQSSSVKNSSSMLMASLFLNVVLVIGLAVSLVLRNGKESDEHPSQTTPKVQIDQSDRGRNDSPFAMTKEAAFQKWGKEWAEDEREKSRKLFEERLGGRQRISNFVEEMGKISKAFIEGEKQEPWKPEKKDAYEKLEAYVLFVEEELYSRQPQNKER